MTHARPMARPGSLALLLVLLCPAKPPADEGVTPEPALQNAERVMAQADALVTELTGWLLSMDHIPRQQNQAAADAMLALGAWRSPQAIPALRKHALFSRNRWRQSPRNFTAMVALAAIGLPAMPALIDIAAGGYEGEALTYPLAPLLADTGLREIMARMLEEAALAERDPDRSQRLTLTLAATRTARPLPPEDLSPLAASGGRAPDQASALLQEATVILRARQAVLKDLTDWLLSMDTIPTEQTQHAAEAMSLLGELRSPRGIPALRKHALFVSTDPATAPKDFVALSALGRIGLPAIPALIDIGAEGPEGEPLDYPLVPILVSMAPPQVMAHYIEQVARDEIDPDRYARLQRLAEELRAEAEQRQ